MNNTDNTSAANRGSALSEGLGLAPERAGLLAQIEACRREVASWPDHMRVVATLRIHPAAMGDE